MVKQNEINAFLQDFHVKMEIWGIIFRDDRGKNTQTLFDLEISKDYRKNILKELRVEDFCQGPLPEKLYGGSQMWVFGKRIKKKEVYIKITKGNQGAQSICISFHIAEHPMTYPYKE